MGVRGISFFAVGVELGVPHADINKDTKIMMKRIGLRMDVPSRNITPGDYYGLMIPKGNQKFLIYWTAALSSSNEVIQAMR